jgi:multiple sugar transport system ATP-binding protein
MGSDKYVYFPLEGERAQAAELEELAADAGAGDLPSSGQQVVARLDAESRVRRGGTARLWLNVNKAHLFDPSSGRTLTGAESGAAPSAAG